MSAQPSSRSANAGDFRNLTTLDPSAIIAVFQRACDPPPLRPPIV